MESIFIGNKITMEGTCVEIPKEIENFKKSIDDAVYNVFESSFVEREQKSFIKTMKMNNVLFDFMEYHVRNFFNTCRDEIQNLSKDDNKDKAVKNLAEDYFIKSLNSYKNKVLSVEF